jgi:murein hydrolase activator
MKLLPSARIAVICMLLVFSTVSLAGIDLSQKLSEVVDKIKTVSQQLLQHKTRQIDLQKQLQSTEVAINDVSQKILELNSTLSDEQKKMTLLQARKQELTAGIEQQQKILLMQLRNAYLLGLKKNPYQIVLQTEDPEQINRMLTYNRYFLVKSQQLVV